MSFITKRDRVFHDYELFDLPSRNEGKLKAFASCTDARAWSHFCSDKTEHLVDVIKRNNETCRPKYVPTDVIVNTLMRSKNKEIARLRRRIAEVEELLTVYDQLDLNSEQKLEILNAHASIREAQKNVEEMFLDLNTSGYTEGIDSDAFETGKSRDDDISSMHRRKGDETGDSILNEASMCSWPEQCPSKLECKCVQMGESIRYDVETSAVDPRIDELQETIIEKDARLNALQNMKAVLENDVCEPYCVYAHIYTALEKIFAVLSHNPKYKKYLDAMLTGRDIRNFDIKGRIVFKMKVLEKFNLALIAPCTQDSINYGTNDCRCCTKIVGRVETTTNIALLSPEAQKMSVDNKRSQLVADIMDNAEMKEILSIESHATQFTSIQMVDDDNSEDIFSSETYNINLINVKRIKDLQLSYDELMNCYDNLKHEKRDLEVHLTQHEELQRELDDIKNEFKEHSQILREKEFYKRKSQQLNELEEKCIELSEEATSLEVQLKAESEINLIKTHTIDDLKSANFELEKTLSEASVAFEKERNALQCKIKKMECKIMCQEQQIKSLSIQIDKLLEQKESMVDNTLSNSDEIDSLNEQIKNLKEVILCKEEEKHNLHDKYQEYIAKLRDEIEDWKNDHNKLINRNEYLELNASDLDQKIQELTAAKQLEKEAAVENLLNIITNKSEKLNELEDALRLKAQENQDLMNKLRDVKGSFSTHLLSLENEKKEAQISLNLARQASQELLEKVRTYDALIQKHEDTSKSYETNSAIVAREIEILKDLNSDILKEKKEIQNELDNYKTLLEDSRNESKLLESKVSKLDDLTNQFKSLKANYEKLLKDKTNLEHELNNTIYELDRTRQSVDLERKKSSDLFDKLIESESSQDEAKQIQKAYHKMSQDKQHFQNKSDELDKKLQKATEDLQIKTGEVDSLTRELDNLKDSYNNLLAEKNKLQRDYTTKGEEVKKLHDSLEKKFEENVKLSQQVQELQLNEIRSRNASVSLENNNILLKNELQTLKQEKKLCDDNMRLFKKLQDDYNNLKHANDGIELQNNKLQKNLETLKAENEELSMEKQHFLRHSEDMEKALVQTRGEAFKLNLQEHVIPDLKKELDKLKQEKVELNNRQSILRDQLEESDNIITNQNEIINAHDGQIANLKREISGLQNKIKQLYDELENVLSLGEQIKENSLQHINQSMDTIQAHQSKATHNMKLELAKMQKEKRELENKMSEHILKTENQYLDNLRQLKQDHEIIVAEIKQLEFKCVGDSLLSVDFCDVENVLDSLERIGKCIDSNNKEMGSLKETLSKVQNSSQILVTKAGEAQKIAEIEQQKINKEKEETIKEKQNLEEQLRHFKEKLENQVTKDKKVIEDLKATAFNQKLIISKITDDINSLQNLYDNCMGTINDLQKSNASLIEEKNLTKADLEAAKQELQIKSEQLRALQTELHLLKNKPMIDCSSQVHREEFQTEMDTQTDKQIDVMKVANDHTDNNFGNFQKRLKGKSHQFTPNEVQVLRADVDSSQDFVKNAQKQSNATDSEFDKVSSQISLNQSLETCKDNESVFKSSTSHAFEVDIDKNTEQLVFAANVLRNKSDDDDHDDKDVEKPNVMDQSGILTIYDNSPASARENNLTFKQETKVNRKPLKRKPKDAIGTNSDTLYSILKMSDTFTSIKSCAVGKDKKSVNSDISSIYGSPIRTTQSLTNIHSEIKSSISHESPSLPNVSNKSSDQGFRHNKMVYNVRTDEPAAATNLQPKKNEPHSQHKLSRVGANDKLISRKTKNSNKPVEKYSKPKSFYRSQSVDRNSFIKHGSNQNDQQDKIIITPLRYFSPIMSQQTEQPNVDEQTANSILNLVYKSNVDRSLMAKFDDDNIQKCKDEIDKLKKALENMEKDYKNKIEVIKAQYDNHIKSILNEHNQGVRSMQSLHEETLQDILNTHENEVENLRTLSIEALRKADKLEKENLNLKSKQEVPTTDDGTFKMASTESKRKKQKIKKTKTLTKTSIEEFNVRPKPRSFGPCTCSLDVNVSDTIRNIFKQADTNQRLIAENTYLKYIVNKIIHDSIDALDSQELSFLHLKVCRTWKSKISKEEVIQKRIDTLEIELLNKQKNAQRHIEELDRQVAEERRRLDEVREAVCRSVPPQAPTMELGHHLQLSMAEKNPSCSCNMEQLNELGERRSLGDMLKRSSRPRRPRQDSNRAIMVKLDSEEHRERRCCNDEQPVRLRKSPAHHPHTAHPTHPAHPATKNRK